MIIIPSNYNEITTTIISPEHLSMLREDFNRKPRTKLFSENNNVFHELEWLSHRDFQFDVIDLYNDKNIILGERKFDRIKPCDNARQVHMSFNRIPIKPSGEKLLEDRKNSFYGSLCWHKDGGFPVNSYKTIIYLNDTTKDTGAICVNKQRVIDYDEKYENSIKAFNSLQDIESEYIEGPAGTAVVFSSNLIHRINIPKYDYRDAVHIAFTT
jgi:hypothetical protein